MKVVGDIFLRSLCLMFLSKLRANMRKKIKLALMILSGLQKRLFHVHCKTCDEVDLAFLKVLKEIFCLCSKAATSLTLMNDPGNLLKCCFFFLVV